MKVENFFDTVTNTLTYVVYDEKTHDAVVIDPVWDFDPPSGALTQNSVNKIINFIESNKLKLHFVLETHAHADHLSAAQIIKQKYPEAKIAIGEHIKTVQGVFKKIFNLTNFNPDGSQFDRLLKEGETVSAGSLQFKVISTPGHTPACSSYLFDQSLFTGDSIFMPDLGTGRCDFPAGSAETLFHSITKKIYALPDDTKIYVGHDYPPASRELRFQSTVGEEKRHNIHITAETAKEKFLEFRLARDKSLAAPRLLLPSIQININAGRLPEPEANGVSYLKLPLKS